MNNELKNKVLELLNFKAPNWVSEIILESRGIRIDEIFQGVIKELESDGIIEKKEDVRGEKGKQINYYRPKSIGNLPIRHFIKIGDVKVPRVVSTQKPSLFPEDYNEAIEQLAIYANGLEKRLENRIKEQQKNYWAKTISVFSILVALLAIILGNAPTLSPSQFYYKGFWYSLFQNFAVLIPFCTILVLFALLIWYILIHKEKTSGNKTLNYADII